MKKKLFTLALFLAATVGITSAQSNFNLSGLNGFDGEPYVAVNPADQNNIISGWMRVRLDGKVWIAVKASFDNGQTWSAISFMPHDTIINGSADVSIAFHNSGVAYISWINFRQAPYTAGAVYVARSTDGGLTWGAPNRVIGNSDLPDNPFDRPWIAVDNSGGVNDGAIYVTSMTAYWQAGQHHIYLRTSMDGGTSWSAIKQVDTTQFSVGSLTASYGGISIGKDGKAYIAFISYDVATSPFIRYYCVTSTDLGSTFQRYVVGNAFISAGSGFTKAWSIDADPTLDGNAVLTWVDNRYGDYDILLSKTTNGGISWSSPIRVNDDPINNGIEQDMVWADFSPSGKLAVAWRDRRLNGVGSAVPFDIYSAISIDTGNSFISNYRVTSVSNPYFLVPQGNSFIGCAMSDSSIYLNWGDYRNSPDWDIYFNKTDYSSLTTSFDYIDRSNQSGISLFPNPAESVIWISVDMPMGYSNNELVIFNSLGQTMMKHTYTTIRAEGFTQEIDILDFPSGVYYLFVKNNNSFFKNTTFIKE